MEKEQTFQTNDAAIMGIVRQKSEIRLLSHTMHKINIKWVTDLYGKAKFVKILLEEIKVVNLCSLRFMNGFLDKTLKVQ
jgi:hypothetical protein